MESENCMSARAQTATVNKEARHEGATTILCATRLDISLVQSLRSRLQEALQAKQPVVLEAVQVERVDTAVLQLFYVFFQEAHARGMPVHWQQPSLALQHAARLLGLSSSLGLPTETLHV
jgi:anti-anti-sigma regulatory factor